MKTLRNIAIAATTCLIFDSAFAAKPLTENQLLGQCKALASSQFENVTKVKMTNMKNTRGTFRAKFRVTAENDKGMFLCTVEKKQIANIVRLDTQNNRITAAK